MDFSPNNRITGVLAPIFALRSQGDQGIGDTQSVIEFLDWAAGAGFVVVQLLPINEMGGDHSPYNALSARALDPTPLRVTPSTAPDLEPGDYERIMRQHGGIGDSPTVDYARVTALKHDLLQAAFGSFNNANLQGKATGHESLRASRMSIGIGCRITSSSAPCAMNIAGSSAGATGHWSIGRYRRRELGWDRWRTMLESRWRSG